MADEAKRLGEFSRDVYGTTTLSQEQLFESLKRTRDRLLRRGWKNSIANMLPRPFGPRVVHVGVPDRDEEVPVDFDRVGDRHVRRRGLPLFRGMQQTNVGAGEPNLHRHVEARDDIRPMILQCRPLHAILEHGNFRGAQILLEDLRQVGASLAADVRFYLATKYRLFSKGAVQAAQDAAPLLVVIHDLANGVQHLAALRIHVARALRVDAIRRG